MSSPKVSVQIVHIQGPFKGEIQEFMDSPILIGRSSSNHIQFPKDLDYISRFHAQIVREENRFKLVDQSTNGTFVNGNRITEIFLRDGDVIMFAENGPKLSFLTKWTQKGNSAESTVIFSPSPEPSSEISHQHIPESPNDIDETIVVPEIRSDWNEIIRDELAKLPLGQILFNPPQEMKVGKAERIEVRITQDLYAELKKGLKGRGHAEINIAKVGGFMKANLTGEHFIINKLNEEEQLVTGDEYTQWAWDVLPLKSGNRTIHLQISVKIILPTTVGRKDHPVIDNEVFVSVNPVFTTSQFVSRNWKWMVTALILPFLAWGIKILVK